MIPVGDVSFPEFAGDQLYMHEFQFSAPRLPNGLEHWYGAFKIMLSLSGVTRGAGYLTIDQSSLSPGDTHRRPGRHVDGNYLFDWEKGGGWLTGHAGRVLSPEKHQAQYCSEDGGLIIASDFSACRAWNGVYEREPRQGGDCSHIDTSKMDEFMLEPNTVYLGNHAIHESMPVPRNVDRSLIRITLPHGEGIEFRR